MNIVCLVTFIPCEPCPIHIITNQESLDLSQYLAGLVPRYYAPERGPMGHLEIASPFMFVYLFLYLSLAPPSDVCDS